MKISFRNKLMLSYLALLLVMSVSVYVYLNHSLQKSIATSLQENLANEARLTGVMAAREPQRLEDEAPALAVEAGRALTARVTLINSQGVVTGDSEVTREKLGELENHLDRPEVKGALQNGQGSAIRYSATLRTDMLYVAVPLVVNGIKAGVVRLALPLTAVDKALTDMHLTLGIALLIALLLSLVFSDILARLTSRPLRQVATIAAGIGEGDFRLRLPAVWHDELGDLARIMNEMAARLDEQLTTLSSEKSRLDAILKGMGEGLMVTDANGAITLVNPAFCRLFSVSEQVVGAPLSHISRHPALHHSYSQVRQSNSELLEEMTLQVAGEKVLLTHWVPLSAESGLGGIVAVFHDISDLKRLENIRKDFVANVSHELRTPVTVIKGYAEALLDGIITENPEQAAKFISIIQNHSDRLTALLTDLLSLSELESANFRLQLQQTPLEACLRRACSLLAEKTAAKSINMVLPSKPLQAVIADQGRLEQVLVNLLDNAVKYTPAGGWIAVLVSDENENVRIAVQDSGFGVPPESIPRLFERFYRVDSGRSRDEGGTGLGLAIVKHIVQLHGGTVRAENNRDGHGATFSFTLKKA
jgi:two-component system phosphate regulon sensor histidine kinase PhoR